MKFYAIDRTIDVVETPVEETGRLIRHLHLAKGKQIPEHKADALVTVVCLEGKVDFADEVFSFICSFASCLLADSCSCFWET